MACNRSMHPAWVDGTNPHSRPVRLAAYPPLAPGEVAYLPVWSWEGGQEGMVSQDFARSEATETAVTKVVPRLQSSPDAESRAMGIIKNLPSRCREEEVLDVISQLGFGSDITSFSMPTRVGKGNRMLNRGFAFVYFSNEEVCRQFVKAAEGYRGFGEHPSDRAISAIFSLHFGGSSRGPKSSARSSQEETEDELTETSSQ